MVDFLVLDEILLLQLQRSSIEAMKKRTRDFKGSHLTADSFFLRGR